MVRVDGCGANIRAHGRKSSRAAERDERDPRVDGWSLRSTMRVSKAKTLEGLSRPLRARAYLPIQIGHVEQWSAGAPYEITLSSDEAREAEQRQSP